MDEFENLLTKVQKIRQHDFCTNGDVVNKKQGPRQCRFQESEQRSPCYVEDKVNITRVDDSNENAAINLAPDTRCNILQQGNLHSVLPTRTLLSNHQHTSDDKQKRICNYPTTSIIPETEILNSESDVKKSNTRDHHFKEFISTLHLQNNVPNHTSIETSSSEEYNATRGIGKGNWLFNDDSFLASDKNENCSIFCGQTDGNFQSILKDEPLDLTLHRPAFDNSKRKFRNSVEVSVPAKYKHVSDEPSSTNTKEQKKLDNRRFSCEKCGKGFRQKRSLINHNRIHRGEKPFQCDKCKKKFRSTSNLIQHQRTHTGEKPFACDKCEKRFSLFHQLTVHLRIHTKEKPFSCGMCDQKFRDLGTVITHRRIHTGEKPFSCDVCDKKFSHCSNVLKHKKSHTKEKKF